MGAIYLILDDCISTGKNLFKVGWAYLNWDDSVYSGMILFKVGWLRGYWDISNCSLYYISIKLDFHILALKIWARPRPL